MVLLLMLCVMTAGAVEPDALLPPSLAFQVEAVRASADVAYVTFTIAPGYALYRDRIGIGGADGAVRWVRMPHGVIVRDAYLGAREEWRYRVIATIGLGSSRGPVHLQVRLQGCADLGVCFNPESRAVTVD